MDQGSYAVTPPTVSPLEEQIIKLKEQIRKLSEREMEARARATAAEDMLEKFFDKMLDKFH